MKKVIIITISLVYISILSGQIPISLEQAIERGIANSIGIQIAKIDQEIANNNNTWKAAGKHPTVTSSLGNNNVLVVQDNPTGFISKATILSNSLDGNVDVAINLYDGGRININKALFEKQALLADNTLKQNIENTIQSVLSAYYQAQILKEQIGTFDEILKLSEDRIAYQNVRKEFGQAGTFDLLQTQDALLNDSTNFLVTLNNYQSALRSLKLAMGEVDSGIQFEVADPLTYEVKAYSTDDLVSRVLVKNTTLQALNLSKDLATAQTELQKTIKKPTLALNGGVNLSLSGTDLFGDTDFARMVGYTLGNSYGPYVNLTARYTIYDGNNIQRNIDNALLEEKVADLNLTDQKRNLSSQIQNAIANYNHQIELINLTESLLVNAKRNIEIAEERFRSAQITSFDYRTIQLSYINANLSKLNSVFNLKMAEMEIDRLTGDLVTYQ